MNEKNPVQTKERLVYRMSRFLIRIIFGILFGLRYYGRENIPRSGPLILASNHITNLDPPTVGSGSGRELYFMAKTELFKGKLFGTLIRFFNAVPVRRGRMDWNAMARLKEIVRAGGALIMFPEGTRSRDGKLGEAKFGVGMLARETGAPIVPVFFIGAVDLRAAFFRKQPMRVYYGEPLSPEIYSQFDDSAEGHVKLSQLVMDRIAELKEKHEQKLVKSTKYS